MPSKAVSCTPELASNDKQERWSPEQIKLYQTRFDEGYDFENKDEDYAAWLKSEHPSPGDSVSNDSRPIASNDTASSISTHSSDVLSEVLTYPNPPPRKGNKRKPAINAKAVCITDDDVLRGLKTAHDEKVQKDLEKQQ